MVVALGLNKFYGKALPRPRIYTDVKFNDHRIDSPVSVVDPLMAWAEEAHWSMGGLSFQRLRLQGRIEGNVKKLRAEREKTLKRREKNRPVPVQQKLNREEEDEDSAPKKRRTGSNLTPSPPAAPVANKRRRYIGLVDEGDEEEEGREVEGSTSARKWPVRKLSEDFDGVANQKRIPGKRSDSVALRTRSQRSEEKVTAESSKVRKLRKIGEVVWRSEIRKSPRLVK